MTRVVERALAVIVGTVVQGMVICIRSSYLLSASYPGETFSWWGLMRELPASTSAVDSTSVMEVCLSSSPSWRDDSAWQHRPVSENKRCRPLSRGSLFDDRFTIIGYIIPAEGCCRRSTVSVCGQQHLVPVLGSGFGSRGP